MADNSLPRTLARISGIAAIAGPVLLLLSSVAYLTAGNEVNDGVLGGTIGVWSCIAIATIGICRLAEPLAPRAAPIVNAVALTGWIGGMSFNITAMYTERYGTDFINDPDLDGADLIGVLAYLPWGWMAPFGRILMGWLLWAPRWWRTGPRGCWPSAGSSSSPEARRGSTSS